MRCPMCNARVKDRDALQIHFIDSCNAIGEEDDNDFNNSSVKRSDKDNEPTSELMEVVFKWQETRDTIEESIYLISSLAGQIKLDRTKLIDVFASAKVIVPCGVHSCQLVVEEDCYPVVDIDIDDTTEVAHIILQDDPTYQSETDYPNAHFGTRSMEQAHYKQIGEQDKGFRVGGAMEQDEIITEYAKKKLNELDLKGNENDSDEVASLRSHDSNYETERMTRRQRKLEGLSNRQNKDNVTTMAKNGLHQVQVHTVASGRVTDGESHLSQSERDVSMRATRRDSQGSFNSDRYEGGKELKGSEIHDYRESSSEIMPRSKFESRKDSKGSLPDVKDKASGEYLVQPPNGFQSDPDQKQRNETKRSKHLTKIAKSKGYFDSPPGQESLESDQGVLERKLEPGKVDDVPLDEKPSWGFDEEKVGREKTSAKTTLDVAELEGVISDLMGKCDFYQEHLDKSRQENQQLETQIADLQQKSKCERELLLSKDERIEEYQAKCDSYETELKRVNTENEKYLDEIVDMTSNNDAITKKFIEQEENMNKKTEEVETLEKRLESLLQDNIGLKEENESLQTAHKLQQEDMDRIIQDEVKSMKNKLKSVKVGSRSFQYEEMKKMTELEHTINRLRVENDQLKQQLQKIKVEADAVDCDRDDTDGIAYANYNYRVSDEKYDDSRSKSYMSRSFSPKEDSYSFLSKYDSTYQPTKSRESWTETRSKSYDDSDSPYLHRSGTSRSRASYDSNQNYMRDSGTLGLRSSPLRYSDVTGSKGSSSGPLRASHYITEQNSELSNYSPRRELDQVLTRERKPRRERPRSFHGATENDSRQYRRNLPSSEHEDLSAYSHYGQRNKDEAKSHEYNLKKYSKPFAPLSIDDIVIGMRVLVTRNSGRTGKGVVKWKGYLEGHSDQFIGIELETPSGKHDGVYEKRRYFHCKRDHGIFSKFSKVVMVWGSV